MATASVSRFRAAVVQAAPVQAASVIFDLQSTLAKVRSLTERAAGSGATLVVFPEAFVGGYPKGIEFASRGGNRASEMQRLFRRYAEGAMEIPGPGTEVLGSIARDCGVYLVIGVVEREGGTLYRTVMFFSPEGAVMGRSRSRTLTAGETQIWGQGIEAPSPVFDTPLGRLGGPIGPEGEGPLAGAAVRRKGIQIYCVPTVDDREAWVASMRKLAFEGQCFVLSAGQFMRVADCPPEYPAAVGNEPERALIHGGSVIVSPAGVVLAGPDFAGEAILTAELDLSGGSEGWVV
ncbi:MAG TPA: nitrilase-related carbon-nitrogen hydrolase [Bryobacteraceae bacterium]|nr:nitrilase-related carbon-nitrogen hydrolase [Bryobacteraceae bacterium]